MNRLPAITGFSLAVGSNARKNDASRKGRFSGGIAVYVKNGTDWREVNSSAKCNNVVYLAVPKLVDSQQVCLGFVYNPPEDSTYHNGTMYEEIIDQLETDELVEFKTILCGDFNARVGLRKDVVDQSDIDIVETGTKNVYIDNETEKNMRQNRDLKFSREGHKLIRFCKNTSYYILNGRTKGDQKGEFTFIGSQGPLGFGRLFPPGAGDNHRMLRG